MFSEKKPVISDSTMKRKSIRFQIELPIQDSDSDFEEMVNLTPVNKIHLKISIDKSSSKKSLNFGESGRKKQKYFLDKSTSGYSSSGTSSLTNSINEYSYLSEIEHNVTVEENFYMKEISGLKRKRDFNSNENIYNRLIHSSGKQKSTMRKSAKIQRKNESIISVSDCISENSCDPDDNIYEEISDFSTKCPDTKCAKILSHQYENCNFSQNCYDNSDFCKNKLSKRSFKREYTVNEIFENLKQFKRQAKEQELLTQKIKNSQLYENNQVSKSIYV